MIGEASIVEFQPGRVVDTRPKRTGCVCELTKAAHHICIEGEAHLQQPSVLDEAGSRRNLIGPRLVAATPPDERCSRTVGIGDGAQQRRDNVDLRISTMVIGDDDLDNSTSIRRTAQCAALNLVTVSDDDGA